MNSPLVRCPKCNRHIYATESLCPFCARQSANSAGVLAAALTAGLAIAGCGSAPPPEVHQPVEVAPPPNHPNEVAEDPKPEEPNSDPIRVAPAYGAAPVPVVGPVMPSPAAYGGPPPMNPQPVPQRP